MGLTTAVGVDITRVNHKETLKAGLEADARVVEVIDVGVRLGEDIGHPHAAVEAARKVTAGEADRAPLVRGMGMGMVIATNKVPDIRAPMAHDSFSVKRLMLSNDAWILTLGERMIGFQLAHQLVREWLEYTFDPEFSSGPKVAAIRSYESDPH